MDRLILAFVDGSPQSEHALPWAAELAARSPAELRLVRPHWTPVSDVSPDGMLCPYPVAVDADVRAAEQTQLDHLLARLKAARPDVPASAVLIDGDTELTFAAALARYVAECQPEFTVLTTHGHGPFARFWLGSVADEYVRHAVGPTLLLRTGPETADLSARPEVQHVLVPLDGSRLAEQALAPAARLAILFGTDITLLQVLDPAVTAAPLPGLKPAGLPDDWQPPPAAEQARQYLGHIARRVRQQNICVHLEVVDNRSPADTILTHHNTFRGGLVALATHGRGGLTRLLLGSVADKVIRGATGPVLVVRPG